MTEPMCSKLANICLSQQDKNNSKQQKGTKCSSQPTKSTKQKAATTKKAVPKPSSKPSPEQSPGHSTGREKSDGQLTDHSFYNSASDKEPTKKKGSTQKSHHKDKSPTHEEHQGKPPSSTAKLTQFIIPKY
ncbi:hypothetical protein DSO57_1000651 [Entomophthora muscae]|uniref:Uncharacterized protein n=1 Tax=Entomophthora muscae TaxID=34485 RepID=A0ACC2TXE1_9FUNG|nr:hypothetical protein DSO57_1000651 [Entomophthora muscae]